MSRIHGTARAKHPRRAAMTLLAVAAAALAWFAVAMGGTSADGGTYAAWNSSVPIKLVSLKTGSAQVQVGGFAALTHQFTSTSTSWEPTTPVTVTNAGTVPLQYFAAQAPLASGSSTALAGNLNVKIWPLASGATACGTAPTSPAPTTGTWAAMPNWLAGRTLQPGSTASYCVLTSITSTGLSAYPGAFVTPAVQVSAATASNDTGWTAGPVAAATFTFSAPTTLPGTTVWTVGNTNITTQVQAIGARTCVTVDVTAAPPGNANDSWKVMIDTTAAPFNAVPYSAANWVTYLGGTGTVMSGPNGQGIISVGGVGNATTNGFSAANNTPVTGTQTAVLVICLPNNN